MFNGRQSNSSNSTSLEYAKLGVEPSRDLIDRLELLNQEYQELKAPRNLQLPEMLLIESRPSWRLLNPTASLAAVAVCVLVAILFFQLPFTALPQEGLRQAIQQARLITPPSLSTRRAFSISKKIQIKHKTLRSIVMPHRLVA